MALKHKRLIAFAAVVIMLAVPFTAIQLQDEEEDSEGIPVLIIPVAVYSVKLLAGIAGLSFAAGLAVGWAVGDAVDSGEDEDDVRKEEAKLLARSLADGTAHYANALNNYQNIWSLTAEHWIRMAELTSSSYWTSGKAYSPYEAMTYSDAYYNSAVMLVNATNQINEQFSTVAEHIGEWNASEYSKYYGDGKMKLEFSIGDSSISAESSDEFSATMGQVVGKNNDRTVRDGRNAVYYVGGPVYASEAATMTGANGNVIELEAGWNNDLPNPDAWKGYDVYRLTPGVTYFGNFMYVKEADAAPVQGGLMINSGSDSMIVTSDGSRLYDGESAYAANATGETTTTTGKFDLFKLSVVPQNSEDRQSSDITAMMVYYAKLIKQIDSVISKANTAARTVWDIYDDAGSASMYLTTLNVPDTYENVEMTADQKRLLVTLYMDQLSTWWEDNDGAIKKENYRLTQDSMTLYCRGTLTMQGVDAKGDTTECKVYENVAFTPIFYKTTTLKTGTHETESQCFALVYGQCSSLSGFDVASYEDCSLVYLGTGSKIGISEMRYGGESRTEVQLVASQVDYIKAEDMENFTPAEPRGSNDMAELIRLIALALGGILIVYGFGRGHPIVGAAGLAIVLIGMIAAGPVADALDRYLDITFEWPW